MLTRPGLMFDSKHCLNVLCTIEPQEYPISSLVVCWSLGEQLQETGLEVLGVASYTDFNRNVVQPTQTSVRHEQTPYGGD